MSLTFAGLARRPALSIAAVGLVSFALNAGVSLFVRMPVPAVHDEFSYLLAADTFAHGRLTNPTPPSWPAFESWHILVRPSYQSKYPPAQGLALAAGQVLFGHPVAGLWISQALACSALCWMLQAWMGRRWALAGGLVAAVHGHWIAAWGQGYWGGAVALLGGALVYGGLRRIARRPRARDAVAMALGLAILANSRPWEGLVCSLPALVLLATRFRPPAAVAVRKILLPMAAVLGPTLLAMGWYNHRVTGDALRLPYSVWKETYSVRPSLAATLFFWEPPSVDLPAAELDRRRSIARNQDLPNELERRSPAQQVAAMAGKWREQWAFHLGPLLTLPLLLLPLTLKRKWNRVAALAVVLVQLAMALEQNRGYTHYTAPAAPLLLLLVMEGLRSLRLLGGPARLLSLLIPPGFAVASAWLVLAAWHPLQGTPWGLDRLRLQRQLEADDGRHLVIVRTRIDHDPDREFVYNGADIEGAKVVWARGLDLASDLALIAHYKNRRVWVLDVDQTTTTHLYLDPWPQEH